jgi:hypothetical protein
MAKQIYREKSLKYISSPEQLNDYLKVTKPAVWTVLAAVVLLLVGLLVWSSFAYIASSVNGVAEVDDGKMVVEFSDARYSSNVEEGMSVVVGDKEIPIVSVGRNDKGNVFAVADTDLEDGTYDVTVTYKQTQVLGLLFGN